MTKLYYRGANAAIVCYDITQPKTLKKVKYWINELRSVEEGCAIYVCALKKDLLDSESDLVKHLEIVENYANSLPAKFYITSSKTGENVGELEILWNFYLNFLPSKWHHFQYHRITKKLETAVQHITNSEKLYSLLVNLWLFLFTADLFQDIATECVSKVKNGDSRKLGDQFITLSSNNKSSICCYNWTRR